MPKPRAVAAWILSRCRNVNVSDQHHFPGSSTPLGPRHKTWRCAVKGTVPLPTEQEWAQYSIIHSTAATADRAVSRAEKRNGCEPKLLDTDLHICCFVCSTGDGRETTLWSMASFGQWQISCTQEACDEATSSPKRDMRLPSCACAACADRGTLHS